MQSTTLDTITSGDTLGRIVPGITRSQINSIPSGKKIATIVNLINASITNGVEMSSTQVIEFNRKIFF